MALVVGALDHWHFAHKQPPWGVQLHVMVVPGFDKIFVEFSLVGLVLGVVVESREVPSNQGVHQSGVRGEPDLLRLLDTSEPLLHDLVDFLGRVVVHPVEEVLDVLFVVGVADVVDGFDFLLELLFEETVVDSDDAFDVDGGDAHGDEVELVVAGFDEVLAALVPLVLRFPFL